MVVLKYVNVVKYVSVLKYVNVLKYVVVVVRNCVSNCYKGLDFYLWGSVN